MTGMFGGMLGMVLAIAIIVFVVICVIGLILYAMATPRSLEQGESLFDKFLNRNNKPK